MIIKVKNNILNEDGLSYQWGNGNLMNPGFSYEVKPLTHDLEQKGNDLAPALKNKCYKHFVGDIVKGFCPYDKKTHTGIIKHLYYLPNCDETSPLYVYIQEFETENTIPLKADSVRKVVNENISDYNLTVIDDDDSIIVKGKKAFDKNNVDYAEEDIINSNYNIDTIMEYYNSSNEEIHKMAEQYLFIDLDLPSKTKWCLYNIGATCKNDADSWCGDYYYWGNIKPIDIYDKLNNNDIHVRKNKYIKYNTSDRQGKVDNKLVLDAEDDIATVTFKNKNIHIPSDKQFEELIKYTDKEIVHNFNDIKKLDGIKFISKKDNSKFIFIPFSGEYIGYVHGRNGYFGYLWTNKLVKQTPYTAITAEVISTIKNIKVFGNKKDSDGTYYGGNRQYAEVVRPVMN